MTRIQKEFRFQERKERGQRSEVRVQERRQRIQYTIANTRQAISEWMDNARMRDGRSAAGEGGEWHVRVRYEAGGARVWNVERGARSGAREA